VIVLRDQAKRLEQQAARLRDLALTVHQQRVQGELVRALQPAEGAIDLIYTALLVAKLDNEELDVDAYRQEIDSMARDLAAELPKNADDKAKLMTLNRFLFNERGFHGSRSDFYNRSNSYLNEVIDDREGLPITISIVYMELARRLGLKVVGINLPGHFLVQYLPSKGEGQLIDVFEQGQPVSRAEALQKGEAVADRPVGQDQLAPVTKKALIRRVLHNLIGIAQEENDIKGMLRYLDTLVAIAPDAHDERLLRAAVQFQLGNRQGTAEDVEWLLDHSPKGMDMERVLRLQRLLGRPEE